MAQQFDHLCPPCTAGEVKKNEHIIIKGHPCKVVDVAHSKTGKHGHAKCNIVGVDVLTGKKYQDVQPAHASMNRAEVTRKEYQLMDVNEEFASCLDDDNNAVDFEINSSDKGKELKAHWDADPEAASSAEITVIVLVAPEMPDEKNVVRREIIFDFKINSK